MAHLKDELDQYLLLQSDQKKNFKIDIKMPSIKVPEMKNLFGKSQPQEANGWLDDTRESCCPKLVCVYYFIDFTTNFNFSSSSFFSLVCKGSLDFWCAWAWEYFVCQCRRSIYRC